MNVPISSFSLCSQNAISLYFRYWKTFQNSPSRTHRSQHTTAHLATAISAIAVARRPVSCMKIEEKKIAMDDVSELKTLDRLKELYPNVTEPLPLCWSSTEKNNSIGLSNSNLRVHYKGTMIFTFSSSGSHPTAMSLPCSIFARRWEVSQRCCVGPNDMPHPRQLWTLLL